MNINRKIVAAYASTVTCMAAIEKPARPLCYAAPSQERFSKSQDDYGALTEPRPFVSKGQNNVFHYDTEEITHIHTYAYICTHMHTYTYIYTHINIYVHIHTYTYIYIHINTYTNIYKHIHTCTNINMCV